MAAVRSLGDTDGSGAGGIRTSTTLIGVLERVAEADEPTQLLTPVDGEGPDDETTVWTTRPPARRIRSRQRLTAIRYVQVEKAASLRKPR